MKKSLSILVLISCFIVHQTWAEKYLMSIAVSFIPSDVSPHYIQYPLKNRV